MTDSAPTTLPFDWAVLDRFFAGDGTAEERASVLHWVAERPTRQLLLRDLQTLGERSTAVNGPADMEHAWNELTERLFTWRPHTAVKRRGALKGINALGRHPIRRVGWYATAAALIGVLGVLVGRSERRRLPRTPLPVATYATTNGQRATITLVDGTTVSLNVASRLEVPADYATGNHTVHLQGEALFTVSHRSGAPFTVRAGGTATRVLGTTFLVRRYDTDTTLSIAVREGRVAVGPTVLTAMQAAQVGSGGVVHVEAADLAQFGFVSGHLTLDSMPLAAAIPDLDRWYDADIRLGDPVLASRPVEGKMLAGSLADLAGILKLTGIRVVRDGRVLTLYQR